MKNSKIIIVSLLLIGAGVGAYYLFKSKTPIAQNQPPIGAGTSTTVGVPNVSVNSGGLNTGGIIPQAIDTVTPALIGAGSNLLTAGFNALFNNPSGGSSGNVFDPYAVADNSQASIDATFAPYSNALSNASYTDPSISGNLVNDYSANTVDSTYSLTGA